MACSPWSPLMAPAEDQANAYDLLALAVESTEQEIRTAYRQRSLKVHPDRNPNNPDAARKFHELNQAYELLLDPLRRLALDAKLRLKQARAERYKDYDAKRKNMVEELEERERAFKKARAEKQQEETVQWEVTERIKDQGRRLREKKEREIEQGKEGAVAQKEEEDAPPALDSLDTTIHIKYSLEKHPQLTTAAAIASHLAPFGATDVESIVISLKGSKSKKDATRRAPRYGTALVPFKQIGDAFAAVCASGREDRGLLGINVGWVGGKEPLILGWLKKMGKLGSGNDPSTRLETQSTPNFTLFKAECPQMQHSTRPSPFSSFPSTVSTASLPARDPAAISIAGIDYESLTLMRLRQAERERQEREIREREADG